MMGPVDYIIVGFKGNNFDGSMLEEITKASKKGLIRVLDLLFIIKDKDGNVIEGEYQDQAEDLKETFGNDFSIEDDKPLLTEADVSKVGEMMKNETAAGVLIIEHLWAKGLKGAIIDAGGFLIADGRIHPEKVEEAIKELETAEA